LIKSSLENSNDRIVTSSLDMAAIFGKEHCHILRDIKNLGCDEEFGESNFGLVEYKDKKGEMRPNQKET
jgi:Rha family phage regulatory protein